MDPGVNMFRVLAKKKNISLVWPKNMNSKDKSNQKGVTGSSILN